MEQDTAAEQVIEKLVETKEPLITEPDTITLYNTKTGLPSKYKVYSAQMLLRKLQQRDSGGVPLFTTNKPSVTPKIGKLKCYLHKDDPNREHYEELGFPTCPKDNLSAPFHVKRHMQKRHKVEWASIEDERKEREKQEERDFQRSLMTRVTEKPPLYVSKKDREKLAEEK